MKWKQRILLFLLIKRRSSDASVDTSGAQGTASPQV